MSSNSRPFGVLSPASPASLIYGPQAIFSPIHPFPSPPTAGYGGNSSHMGRASSHPINIQPISPTPPFQTSAPTATMVGFNPAGSPIRSPPLRLNSKDSRSSSPQQLSRNTLFFFPDKNSFTTRKREILTLLHIRFSSHVFIDSRSTAFSTVVFVSVHFHTLSLENSDTFFFFLVWVSPSPFRNCKKKCARYQVTAVIYTRNRDRER